MKAICKPVRWFMLVLLMAGCTAKGERPIPEIAPPEAPPALTAPAEGQVFRYVDPSDGVVKTASTVEAIPEGARKAVLVFDATAPTPPGWEHVADLTITPATTVPTQGYTLRPTVVVPPQSAPSKATRKAAEVVMFSTQSCGYCRKARQFFDKNGVAHSEYDIERDPKAAGKLGELAKAAGVPVSQLQGGVPLIFINGTPHVGFDQAKIGKLLGI